MTFSTLVVLATLLANDGLQVEARIAAPTVVAATPLTLEVTATAPEEMPISPAWPAVIGTFEIVSSTERSGPSQNGSRIRKWDLRMITFAAGPAQIPPIEVVVDDLVRGTRETMASLPIAVMVQAAPVPSPDDPLRLPLHQAMLSWSLVDGAIGAAATLAAVLVWHTKRRQRRPGTSATAAEPVPAIVQRAMTIHDLRAALPRNAEQIEQFYDLAARVARGAIGNRAAIASEALPSRELIHIVRARRGQQVDSWIRWLARIDRVRFGHVDPPASEPAELVDALDKLLIDWAARDRVR